MSDHLSHIAAADAWNSAVSSGASLAFTSQTLERPGASQAVNMALLMQRSAQHDADLRQYWREAMYTQSVTASRRTRRFGMHAQCNNGCFSRGLRCSRAIWTTKCQSLGMLACCSTQAEILVSSWRRAPARRRYP
jgi:hypothetical protein